MTFAAGAVVSCRALGVRGRGRKGKGEKGLMWASQGAHLSPRLAGGIQTPGGAALPLILPHPQPQA